MTRKRANKGRPKQRANTNAKRMDVENPQSDSKPQRTSWWIYIRHPTTIIDVILSRIIWIQVIVYQKCAGRMPLFLKGKEDDQEQQIQKLNGEMVKLSEQNKSLSDENSRISNRNMELEKKHEITKEERNNLRKGNLELNDRLSKLNQEIKNLKEERKSLDKNSEALKKEIQNLKESNQDLLNDKRSLEDSNAGKKKENERLESENTSLREESDNHYRRNNKLTNEVSKQSNEIQSLKQKNNNQAYDIEQADTCIKDLKQELWNFEVLVRDKESIIQDLFGNINKLTEEKNVLEGEKQEALRRLSEQVSVKLRDNNPNIVDLSDPCRATKLAEMFAELYDNEWTDAFGALEENLTEEQAIVVLLDAVLLAYKFCEQRVEEPWKTLEDWFLDESLPGNQQTSKWLKDSRKVRIKDKVPKVKEIFTENVLRICADEDLKVVLSKHNDLSTYFAKCIEVCLLMVTTDPPVVLVCPGRMECLPSQLLEEREEKDHSEGENSKPSDEISDDRQNTSDENSDFSKDSTKIEECSKTQDPMNDPHSKTTDNKNKEELQGKSQQAVQEQYESGPQSNDDPAKTLPEETEHNEDSGTNGIDEDEAKIERDGNNILSGNENESCMPPANIDNSSLFDSVYQSMPLQNEISNQTIDLKTELENEKDQDGDSGTNNTGEGKNEIKRDENNTVSEIEQKSCNPPADIDNTSLFESEEQSIPVQDETCNQTSEHKTEVENLDTDQNEGSGTNDIGEDKNNNERDENNTVPEIEQKSCNPQADIDNTSLFESEEQSIPVQDETCNQTSEHKTEVENCKQQMEEEIKETNEGSRHVLNENGNQQEVTVADDQIPNVKDKDDNINKPNANSDENNIISSNGLHGKISNGLNGKTSENTTVDNMEFDKEIFKEYTSRGKFLDYVVWPAMRLHENGPLLNKGVAQGCKNKTKEIKKYVWTWMNH